MYHPSSYSESKATISEFVEIQIEKVAARRGCSFKIHKKITEI